MTWLPTMTGASRREVLLVEVGDLDVPALLAGARVEGDEIVVVRLHVQVVAPHADAAMAGVRAAARLPVELPEHRAVARVDRPEVVGRGRIEHAVHHQDRSANGRGTAGVELAGPLAADDDRRTAATAAAAAPSTARRIGRWVRSLRSSLADPGQPEILDGALVDLRERAVAPAGEVARVARPGVGRAASAAIAGSTPRG